LGSFTSIVQITIKAIYFSRYAYTFTHAHQSKILLLADSVHFVTAILLRVRHQFIANHHATRKVDKYGRYKKDMGKLDRDTYGDVSNKSCRVKIFLQHYPDFPPQLFIISPSSSSDQSEMQATHCIPIPGDMPKKARKLLDNVEWRW